MVVPKNADGSVIEAEMARFSGMQYCKTDLIASKGIVFVKYSTSSSACLAMETVQLAGSVAGYKVKIMLAEPKTRRTDTIAPFLSGSMQSGGGILGPHGQHSSLAFSSSGMNNQFLPPLSSSNLLGPGMGGLQDFSIQSSVGSMASGFPQGLSSLGNHQLDVSQLGSQQSFDGFAGLSGLGGDVNYAGLGSFATLGGGLTSSLLGASGAELTGGGQNSFQSLQGAGALHQAVNNGHPNCRLFVVVHKSVSKEALDSLFQCFHGLEYVDLKRDRLSGRSKGYAYVNYADAAAAAAAQTQLNGIEYPPGSGCPLKVMYAEPLGMSRSHSADAMAAAMMASETFPAEAAAAAHAALLGTPSQDTTTTVFQLPSPNSGDSAGHATSLGVVPRQLSARTDLSSGSHDHVLSPNSSPLRMNSEAAVAAARMDASLDAVHTGLGGLNLGISLGNGIITSIGQQASPHSTSRGSGPAQSDSGDAATGSWRESSPDHLTATSAGISPAKLLSTSGVEPSVAFSALAFRAPGAGVVSSAAGKST